MNKLPQLSSVSLLTPETAESQILTQVFEVIDPPEYSRCNQLIWNFPSSRIPVWARDGRCACAIPGHKIMFTIAFRVIGDKDKPKCNGLSHLEIVFERCLRLDVLFLLGFHSAAVVDGCSVGGGLPIIDSHHCLLSFDSTKDI